MSRKWAPNLRTLGAMTLALLVVVVAMILLRFDKSTPEQGLQTPDLSDSSHVDGPVLPATELEPRTASEKERGPASVPRQEAERLLVEVFSDGDRRVVGARVLLFDQRDLLGSATTGENGTCSFQAAEGEGEVLAWTEGRAPHRQHMKLAAGGVMIRLSVGAQVSGSVRLPDGRPGAGLPLVLLSDRALFENADLPAAVLAALPGRMSTAAQIDSGTDDTGRFAFTGLDSKWTGTLGLANSHWLLDSSTGTFLQSVGPWPYGSGVRLSAPVQDLLIEALELPALVGRIVTSDGSAGVPRAKLMCTIGLKDVNNPPMTGSTADDDGRFRIPVSPINQLEDPAWRGRNELPALDRVEISAWDPAGSGAVRRVYERGEMRGPWDVGDVPLAKTRSFSFLVRDRDGQPVAGAVARTAAWGPSPPTDAEGRGRADGVPEQASTLIVGAQGHVVTRVQIPPDPLETISVVLARTNRLVVHVRSESGSPPEGVRVEVACTQPLFAATTEWTPDKVQVATGDSSSSGATWGPQGGASYFLLDSENRVVLSGLAAGQFLTLRVRGEVGGPLHEEPPFTLGSEETRSVEIVLHFDRLEFIGKVLDEEGRPLAAASVELSYAGSGRGVQTDSRGEFRMQGIARGPFRLEVSKGGYAPISAASYEIPEAAGPVEFRLSAGHRVRVRVIDAMRRPVKDSSVVIQSEDVVSGSPAHVGDGVFEFSDLPATSLTFVASVGGVDYRKEHDPLQPELTIEVPLQGSVVVHVPEDLSIEPKAEVRFILEENANADARSRRELVPDERNGDAFRLGAILPGEYVVRLQVWIPSEGGRESAWAQRGQDMSITVKADETTQVDLKP